MKQQLNVRISNETRQHLDTLASDRTEAAVIEQAINNLIRRSQGPRRLSLPVLRRQVAGEFTELPGPFVDGEQFQTSKNGFIYGNVLVVHMPEGDIELEGGNVNRNPSVLLRVKDGWFIPTEMFFDPLPQ